MNKFIHRIFGHRARSSVTLEDLLRDASARRAVWLGEFHSEPRILALQNEMVVRLARHLGSCGGGDDGGGDDDGPERRQQEEGDATAEGGGRPKLHVVMEHFSLEMQPLLSRFQSDPAFGMKELVEEYRRTGTEGHSLEPYAGFLRFCRSTTLRRAEGGPIDYGGGGGDGNGDGDGEAPVQDGVFSSPGARVDRCCEVRLHGGFIPRPYAARLNKCSDLEERRRLFDEIVDRGWLPGEASSPAMRRAMFGKADEERDGLLLRGSLEHYRLIESLMNGRDLYAPVDGGGEPEEEGGIDQTTPLARLYQAQLLKDHAMGYFLANLLLDHASSPLRRNDRYLLLTGYGHVKHYLGVPSCLEGYLKAESLYHPDVERREAAMDVSTNLIGSGGKEPCGQVLIGSQMLYETYLEEKYAPLAEAEDMDEEEEDEEEAKQATKRTALRELYESKTELMDELILGSDMVRGPLLNPSAGAGAFGRPCADYLFVYDEDDENVLGQTCPDGADADAVTEADSGDDAARGAAAAAAEAKAKAETLEAYESVGRTAGRRGNVAKARAIMTRLGYSDLDLDVVGEDDMYNFQGVANPHIVANVEAGERVLDVGSGLGVDSFLAAHACGADGRGEEGDGDGGMVVGIDLSSGEVAHATKRAAERGLDPARVRFLRGDAERLDDVLPDDGAAGTFDVCISNGAFCLIPDKRRAFEQVYRTLKAGGRMAVSTTTIQLKDGLDPDFEWPVCMRMFVNLDEVRPMCEGIGFKNVRIVDADSPLEGVELPEEALEEEEREKGADERRFKIHGKYAEHFKHLEKMDMDELCKVVTVYGEK